MSERGVKFKRGSLHDDFGRFDRFGGSGGHLALRLLVLQNTVPRGNRDGFGGFSSCDGFGPDDKPPQTQPPFSDILSALVVFQSSMVIFDGFRPIWKSPVGALKWGA